MRSETIDRSIITRYIDLTNEELFYFQHHYIPKEISKEWIDGMIDFIPITNKSGNILNKDHVINYFTEHRIELLKNFPRIQNALKIQKNLIFP